MRSVPKRMNSWRPTCKHSQKRKICPKRKFSAGHPCGHPAKNFGLALQNLAKSQAFRHRHAAEASTKTCGLKNFWLIFRSLNIVERPRAHPMRTHPLRVSVGSFSSLRPMKQPFFCQQPLPKTCVVFNKEWPKPISGRGCDEALFSERKGLSVERGEAIQWMGGLVRILKGKAIQWRGSGHSLNRWTLKSEKLLSSSPCRKSALKWAPLS